MLRPRTSGLTTLFMSFLRIALAAVVAASISLPSASRAAPKDEQGPEPVMMTYDFRTEVKSTTFSDGTVLEESFDPQKARKFAPKPTDKGVTSNREQ